MNDGEIRCENLVKVYNPGHANEYTALRGINLTIKEGQAVGVMGPSGSGKSTLLNLISCLDTPTRGDVYIEGVALSELNDSQRAGLRREKLGFVFQQFNLIRGMTAYENIELPMRLMGKPKKERATRIRELLSLVGLDGKGGNRPTELSGGEQQRVAIARALANNPKIILADEPTGNLDTKNSEMIMRLLTDLNRKDGRTLIVVTHEQSIAKKADVLVRLKDGLIESK